MLLQLLSNVLLIRLVELLLLLLLLLLLSMPSESDILSYPPRLVPLACAARDALLSARARLDVGNRESDDATVVADRERLRGWTASESALMGAPARTRFEHVSANRRHGAGGFIADGLCALAVRHDLVGPGCSVRALRLGWDVPA